MLSSKQTKALEVFVEYFTIDYPYRTMERTDYCKLHKHFKNLPEQVFSNRKIKTLWHLGIRSATKSILHTDSGIVSCTTTAGIKRLVVNLGSFKDDDFIYKITPPKRIVSASKLLSLANKNTILVYDEIRDRASSEHEYVVLLDNTLEYAKTGKYSSLQDRFIPI